MKPYRQVGDELWEMLHLVRMRGARPRPGGGALRGDVPATGLGQKARRLVSPGLEGRHKAIF